MKQQKRQLESTAATCHRDTSSEFPRRMRWKWPATIEHGSVRHRPRSRFASSFLSGRTCVHSNAIQVEGRNGAGCFCKTNYNKLSVSAVQRWHWCLQIPPPNEATISRKMSARRDGFRLKLSWATWTWHSTCDGQWSWGEANQKSTCPPRRTAATRATERKLTHGDNFQLLCWLQSTSVAPPPLQPTVNPVCQSNGRKLHAGLARKLTSLVEEALSVCLLDVPGDWCRMWEEGEATALSETGKYSRAFDANFRSLILVE